MSKILNILILEDDIHDIELMVSFLEEIDYKCYWKQVQTRQEFLTCLNELTYDLILADYNLPTFDGLTALNLFLTYNLDIPFILVSGILGEETAIEALRAGATDYVLKDRLSRLGPVVQRALKETEDHRHHQQIKAELQTSETRFQEVISSISDHIYVTELTKDKQYINHYFSPNLQSLTGYPISKFIDSNDFWAQSFIYPTDQEIVTTQLSKLTQGEDGNIEYRIVRADGEIVWIRDSSRVKDEGDSKFIYGVISDITNRKQLEDQLLQAQKMEAVGRLAGGIAHDFNNILTIIVVNSILVLRKLEPGDAFYSELESIKQAGEQAALLTRQLLAFSRRQVSQPKILNLNNIITNTKNLLGPLIGEDIELITDLAPDVNPVKIDPGHVEQVIMNLVVNACDAMPQGGKLTIKTENICLDETNTSHQKIPAGLYSLLRVIDTGTGISAKTLPHIFEPFFTTKEVNKGTGLGLSTVYGIVQQNGGYIEVDTKLDEGTTFRIFFPCIEQASATFLQTPKPTSTTPSAQQTILLVEDDPSVRFAIAKYLQQKKYVVIEAEDGQQAQQIVATNQNTINLLLTDVVMPGGVSGFQLAQELLPSTPNLKVLYISGYPKDVIPTSNLQDPNIAFLQKPFAPDILIATIQDMLN